MEIVAVLFLLFCSFTCGYQQAEKDQSIKDGAYLPVPIEVTKEGRVIGYGELHSTERAKEIEKEMEEAIECDLKRKKICKHKSHQVRGGVNERISSSQ